jgi:hypothetical protein
MKSATVVSTNVDICVGTVKLDGLAGGAGDVEALPAESAERTRKKYVVFGASPVSVTRCEVSRAVLTALRLSDEGEVP